LPSPMSKTAMLFAGQASQGVGIATQKLRARGPMALRELTSTKWLGRGTGQVRR